MRNSIKSILNKLIEIKSQVEDSLSKAESANHPNDERIDKLANEVDCLDEAIVALEAIE